MGFTSVDTGRHPDQIGRVLKTLLQLQRAVRRNRWRSLGRYGQLAVALGGLGAIVGLVLGGGALLRPDETADLGRRVEMWAFWSMTAAALIFGYTSFEVMYRDRMSVRLSRLPVAPRALFWWKVVKVYQVHLPLVLLPALSGATLLWTGHTGAWLQGVGACAGALIWGLAAAIYAHAWAGGSLTEGGSELKSYMAQGFGPPETAFLFYSPAMALIGALLVGMLCDLGLMTGTTRGIWKPMLVLSAVFTGGGAVALWKAASLFGGAYYEIQARFAGAEILPPWREGDLPRRYLGEGLGRWMPPRLRPLWRRTLVQYRRRFRVVLPLLVVAAAAVVLFGTNTADAPGGPLRLALVCIALGIVAFTPVFRAAGPELGTRFDARALPVRPADEAKMQWVLAATEWGPLAVAVALGSLLGGFGIMPTLGVLLAVALAFAVVQAAAIPAALRAAPEVRRISWGLRGALLLALGGASELARLAGA